VVLNLKRPVVARIATITEWPLVLIDLATEEGVTGRAYLAPYIVKAMRYLVPALHDLGANIVSLETTQWDAPFTGATLFRIALAAEVPKETTLAKVRNKMEEVSAHENLDIEVRSDART